MTFPTIPTVAAGRVLTANQADTTATRTFPAFSGLTYSNGDLLLAVVTTYQSTTNPQFSGWSNGFTELSAGGDQGSATTMGIGIAYKIASGTESGSLTVTQAATITGHASLCLMAIPLAHPTTAPEAGTIANGTAAAADPGSFNPAGWGTEDTLWISVVASGMTSGTGSWTAAGTAGPTNYGNWVDSNTTDNSTVGQTEIAVSFQQLNAASEDVGTAGVDTSNARNSALVIAVRPAPAAQTLTQSSSFSNSNGLTYAHTLTPGAVALTQSARFDNANGLAYAHTVTQGGADQSLTQSSSFSNSNGLAYAHTLAASITLAQSSRYDNANGLTYTHTLTPGAVALSQAARFDNAATFYTHTLTPGAVALSQSSRFDNGNGLAYSTLSARAGRIRRSRSRAVTATATRSTTPTP
jgi:hypothetical protein